MEQQRSGSGSSQSPRSPSAQPFLSVSVTDPVKLGNGVQAYISYRVITKILIILMGFLEVDIDIIFPAILFRIQYRRLFTLNSLHGILTNSIASLMDNLHVASCLCAIQKHSMIQWSCLSCPTVCLFMYACAAMVACRMRLDYSLFWQTNLPEYQGQEKIVIRRYSDFVWLRDRLFEKYKGIFVPPLPEKSAVEKFRFSAEFIEMRRQALDIFVNRIASHHELQQSEDLRTFLQADEEVIYSITMLLAKVKLV
ncbi:Sorting nexin 1 [Vitis vinifera]|uniref:Sorting nexin 1 n=1 Tax=Vitis vinifera TaxID=29760 RepID=A0A438EK41_VITVI|nr:Sorting nexin 1 [Vitis vinifera]